MPHEAITQDVIGAAMTVLNELRPGLDEKLYENALVIELLARGHTVEQQRELPVHYRGRWIGKLVPDLIVDGVVLADPKVVSAFNETHIAQMLGCLSITNPEVAILPSFKEAIESPKSLVRLEFSIITGATGRGTPRPVFSVTRGRHRSASTPTCGTQTGQGYSDPQ